MVHNKDNAAECLQAIDRFIGFRIRSLRFKNGLSRQQLAAMLSIASAELEEYETACKTITIDMLDRIARLCGTSIYFFYQGLDSIVKIPSRQTKNSKNH